MLDFTVTVENDRVVIAGLTKFSRRFPGAVRKGLTRIAKGVHREAYDFLSGAKSDSPGGFPVPVLTGHLRRMLDWLKPGASKSTEVGTFTAGDSEVVLYDSAEYAEDIFSGKGTSSAYGPRDALWEGFAQFNQGARIDKILDDEIGKEIRRTSIL